MTSTKAPAVPGIRTRGSRVFGHREPRRAL